MAETSKPELFEAERPRPLSSFGKPLLWTKEKQLKEVFTANASGKNIYHSFTTSNYEDEFKDQNGVRTNNGRRKLFNAREQKRASSRLLRLGTITNRNAVDFGNNQLGPTKQDLLRQQQIEDEARKALAPMDEDEEMMAQKQGIEVFGRVRAWMRKSKGNLRSAFQEFDTDNSGSLGPLELRYALSKIGISVIDHEFELMVRMIDQDGNGTVEFVEFMDAVEFYGRMADGHAPVAKPHRGRQGNDLLYLDFPKYFQFPLKNPFF